MKKTLTILQTNTLLYIYNIYMLYICYIYIYYIYKRSINIYIYTCMYAYIYIYIYLYALMIHFVHVSSTLKKRVPHESEIMNQIMYLK